MDPPVNIVADITIKTVTVTGTVEIDPSVVSIGDNIYVGLFLEIDEIARFILDDNPKFIGPCPDTFEINYVINDVQP